MFWRWLWYLTVARLIDGAVVLLAGLIGLPVFFMRRGSFGDKKPLTAKFELKQLLDLGSNDPVRDTYFSDCADSHNLMCQVGHGFFNPANARVMAAQALSPDGSLYRYAPGTWGDSDPSRDMLSAWTYFYCAGKVQAPNLVQMLAEHHWNNVFSLRNKDSKIGSRCCNAGVAYCDGNDGHFSGPTAGQSYLATAGLLALAARELGGCWTWRYRLYWFMSFGWFWQRFPWIPMWCEALKDKTDLFYGYVGHTTQMSLYVLSKCGRDSRWGLRWNAIIAKVKQDAPQPFLAGMAAECGALSDEERQAALKWLLATDVTWPQYFTLFSEPGNKTHSMMAHCAVQLTGGLL